MRWSVRCVLTVVGAIVLTMVGAIVLHDRQRNGVTANGGAIDGPGPVVADGMLYLTSGYVSLIGRPGNVLLAFGVD